MTRRITIDPITRLEGHGKIEILLDEQGNAASAYLQVPELRGFERFCVGRPAEEMPQLTAHVCGVCPAAHHIASVRALDALYGVTPPVAARRAQALYYNLFVFEDHLLHYWYMGGPDFYAGPKAPAPMRSLLGVLARVGQDLGKRILSVRKEARDLMAALAGRTVHPVFALPGGISKAVDAETVGRARDAAPRLVQFAVDTLESFRAAVLGNAEYAAAISSEVFRVRCHSMGMVDEAGRVAFLDGRIRVVDPAGNELALFDPRDYLAHVAERVEPWTYAKLTYLADKGWKGFTEGSGSGIYRVGPLARLNVAKAMATPRAETERQRLFEMLGWPAHQTLAFHWARLVEALQAAEMVQLLANDPDLAEPEVRIVPAPLAGPAEGVGAVEAPRGTLFHHYATDADGMLTAVNLVVASQHNAAPVQISVRKAARGLVKGGKVDDGLLNLLEMAFRAYDPCNACASHALPGELPLVVTVRGPDGAVRDVVRRRVSEDEG
ncbi:Ni/Fe hydrogenase subunit alpha [Anaeromyxobacter oryzae]|uniref:F420-non-reducing hydrogenase subunit A, selenocysteine-containing n=1 Tax=Anaeromyxobacter oryzae TaxID=2918170 RepID=A0ABM7WUZ0_9BACT|nr:Ni/Fe hydrogenase subunit alpha [Anaeromyxobacter oryzae]BDG03275.1 F420-non-reducing hydrogenase subunit A, selenocysteine-containing [Anaeromyxobacter oryzae]